MKTIKTSHPSLCIGLLASMVLISCEKILDIERGTESNTTPVSVADFEQILNNEGLTAVQFGELNVLTDDIHWSETKTNPYYSPSFIPYVPFYFWQAESWANLSADSMFGESYKWIAQMNLVIEYMPTATPEGLNERRAIAIAQAKIYRAYFYLQLVNIYGVHYQSNTAATDLAVPLVLKAGNNTSNTRASVAQVYLQVIKDLQEALATPELPDMGSDIIHPGRAAALALQARTYLYMGNYAEAEKSAVAALEIKNGLLDYRNYPPATTNTSIIKPQPLKLLDQKNNPEVLMAGVQLIHTGRSFFYPNNEMLAIFEPNDMRLIASFEQKLLTGGSIDYTYLFGYIDDDENYLNTGIGVPEIMLIRSECLARANKVPEAINLLNSLRQYRFKVQDYRPLPTNVDAESALRMVLDERRRELVFRGGGLRLFDLKRLNLDPRFKKDLQRLGDKGQVLARLPAGSPRYVLPFHPSVMAANPLLVQNPR